jgi:hypothetical protein
MEDERNKIVGFFHRHLVPLCAVFTIDNKAEIYVATAFVLSVRDIWFLVTAGHVGLDIKKYLENPDYNLEKAFLYDAGGHDSVHSQLFPFELTSDTLIVLGDEKTLDYAFILILPYYRDLLIANNIVPLNEETWLTQPKNPNFYWMIGIPRQMISVKWNNDTNDVIDQVNFATTLLHVRHASQRPVGLAKRSYARWYGYATLAPPIDDISGMSGAPIFAFRQSAKGELRYWLIGILSSWNKGNRAISACLAQNLSDVLVQIIARLQNGEANKANSADAKSRVAD